MTKFDVKEWAIFGGAITAVKVGVPLILLALGVAGLFGALSGDAEVATGLAAIGGVTIVSVLIPAIVIGAISWIVLGYMYVNFLSGILKSISTYWKVVALQVVATGMSIAFFGEKFSILAIIIILMSAWITLFIAKLLKLTVPFK